MVPQNGATSMPQLHDFDLFLHVLICFALSLLCKLPHGLGLCHHFAGTCWLPPLRLLLTMAVNFLSTAIA